MAGHPQSAWVASWPRTAVHGVCWQLNRALKSKKVDYRKNWGVVDSWLSFTPSSTVNSISLSGTGVAASGIPGKTVSTTWMG